jgi:quercetin dioxygenase-like cupin family protein
MEIVAFDAGRARQVTHFGSDGFGVVPMVRAEAFAVTVLHLAAGGVVGTHPAVVDQLLMVVSGSGETAGADGDWRPIRAGQAALWVAGEQHTTRAFEPMVALAVEAAGLRLSVITDDAQ